MYIYTKNASVCVEVCVEVCVYVCVEVCMCVEVFKQQSTECRGGWFQLFEAHFSFTSAPVLMGSQCPGLQFL
ncbi:hypothetical protein STEG23_023084 [Scotinomys teguina]